MISKETHKIYILTSLVQFPISGGREPEKLFMSIALLKRKKNQCEVEKENDHDIHKEGGGGPYSDLKSVRSPISLGTGPDKALAPKVLCNLGIINNNNNNNKVREKGRGLTSTACE